MGTSKNLSGFLALVIPFLLASCAATVTFNVEHPPLVDLRNVNTITVIPFEWNTVREYEDLSKYITSALITGAKGGGIKFVDPYSARNTHGVNYRSYADVYITGKIIRVIADNRYETMEDTDFRNERIRRSFTISTVSVAIEYSYIRSLDNKELGYFRKTETDRYTYEHPVRRLYSSVYENPGWRNEGGRRAENDRSGRRYENEGQGRRNESGRRADNSRSNRRNEGARTGGRRNGAGGGRYQSAFRQSDPWAEGAALSAIRRFAETMNQEVASWTTTEERNIKGRAGKDTQLTEAKKLVRHNYYDEALDIYREVYEQTGSVPAAYNTAVLLEATDNFTGALDILENLSVIIIKTGKKIPAFITREIKKLKDFINDFKILEGYKKENVSDLSPPSTGSGTGENFSGDDPFMAADVKNYRMVSETDAMGRIVSQTMFDGNDKTLWIIKNTWSNDRITVILRIEGEDVKLTEYEYDGMGNRIVQRDLHNGVLERLVFTDGGNETEELYINGDLALRAYWENGRKIREEQVRRR